jgi:hypothetical protein
MEAVSALRAVLRAIRRQPPHDVQGAGGKAPPVFWGRIGDYEAVTRQGVLFLLSQEPAHPSRRVTTSAG